MTEKSIHRRKRSPNQYHSNMMCTDMRKKLEQAKRDQCPDMVAYYERMVLRFCSHKQKRKENA